jgi:hypothetical protein
MQRFVRIILLVYCFVFAKQSFSQDIRAGWINYKWMGGYTYSITVTLLTDDINPDTHCKVNLSSCGDAIRENGSPGPSTAQCPTSYNGVIISITPTVKKNIYSCVQTFSGPGSYTIYLTDSLRTPGIKNISNSQIKTFYIQSTLNISAFLGPNSTPVVTNLPIKFSSVSGNNVLYNPGLSDPDGDSLSYQLINCLGTSSTSISHYIPGNATLDAYGTLSFNKDSIGLYAFSYEVKEWRKDASNNPNFIGSTRIDFVLDVDAGVGIKEFDKKELFSVHPNPASGILNIKTNSKSNSDIEIINSLGQIVFKQKYSESIDVSRFAPGYYFIRINNSYNKFIKE